jgi:hypothetical protein
MAGRVVEREEVVVMERWGSDDDGRRGRREMERARMSKAVWSEWR